MGKIVTENNFSEQIMFRTTQDGSVGLYNNEVADIYHSTYGAISEAVEKFVSPLNFSQYFYNRKELNVLDICYGIGYNTKAFLLEIFKYNYEGKIHIDALEYDKRLISISPFIQDNIYSPAIDYILLNSFREIILNEYQTIKSIVAPPKFDFFLRQDIKAFLLRYPFYMCTINPQLKFNAFLHNIYYQCISKRDKMTLKRLRNNSITITPHTADARATLKMLNSQYDIVFLDAFTPTKLPTLWTEQFFTRLFDLMNPDSLLLTYSNSAAVRNAMLKSGFHIGKILNKYNKPCGTIASKNQSYIHTTLSDFELGLLSTTAGVTFVDPFLNSSADDILKNRLIKIQNSNLESSSHYLKHRKVEKCMTC